MSNYKVNKLKKREYLKILNYVVDFCLWQFGYSVRPCLREAKLGYGEMMMSCNYYKHYTILYDWQKFRKMFGKQDYLTQVALAMSSAAHEMRHYYQVRQIFSRTPSEDEKTLDGWWENHINGKYVGEDCTILEFFMQPMELDAELYSYWYVAKTLDCRLNLDYIDKNFINVLKNKFIEMFGADHKDLYIFDTVQQ